MNLSVRLAELSPETRTLISDCGHDFGLDPHDADPLGERVVCADCCTTCTDTNQPKDITP